MSRGPPTSPRAIWEPAPYVRMLPKFFEHLRSKLGDEDALSAEPIPLGSGLGAESGVNWGVQAG